MNAASGSQQIKRLKAEEFELKNQLQKKYRDIEGTIGHLGNKKMLKDNSNTFIDLDKTQGRVELEVPLSPASRKKKKKNSLKLPRSFITFKNCNPKPSI